MEIKLALRGSGKLAKEEIASNRIAQVVLGGELGDFPLDSISHVAVAGCVVNFCLLFVD